MQLQPQKGRLLISEPFLLDPNFKRSVILLCEHNEDGSFGLVLNKKLDLTLSEVVPDLDFFDASLYYGGPVEPKSTLHYLHNYGDMIDGSVQLSEGIYWGGDFEQVIRYFNTGQIEPTFIRFFLGYSGWETKQLDDEMDDKSWIVAPAQAKYIFDNESPELWREVLRDLNDDNYRVMSHFPESPSLN